jgi:hypothetical protein
VAIADGIGVLPPEGGSHRTNKQREAVSLALSAGRPEGLRYE